MKKAGNGFGEAAAARGKVQIGVSWQLLISCYMASNRVMLTQVFGVIGWRGWKCVSQRANCDFAELKATAALSIVEAGKTHIK